MDIKKQWAVIYRRRQLQKYIIAGSDKTLGIDLVTLARHRSQVARAACG